MPKPVYMLCCHELSEDKETGLLTLATVVEKFLVRKLPEPKPGQILFIPFRPMRVVAVWMREQDDAQEYDFEFRVRLPDGNEVFLGSSQFSFPDKPFYRLIIRIDSPFSMNVPGVTWLECRVRAVGTEAWQSQRYPILVEHEAAEQQAPPPG